MRSKPIDPTPEQRAVIDATERSLVVLASAGAGKTGTLVERYLRHVREGVRPDQILTITFTRKAAAEMKERIVDALMAQGMRDEAQVAETGPIQTIHGFCERLLRENSVAAGMDPEFDVLAESEASRMMDTCIRRAISEPTGECGYSEALISKLAGESEYGYSSPHGKLEAAVREALNSLRGAGVEFDLLWQIYSDPSAIRFHWQSKLLESVPSAVRDALDDVPAGESVFERLRSAYKLCALKMPRWLSSRVAASVDQEAAEQACGLMHIVCSAWAMLDREMDERQGLDFVALEQRAERLLRESKSCAERVRRQYKLAMVDEAQDINPMQYRLLTALGLDSEMLVGDPQQSIYGFRQADVELFMSRAREKDTKRLTKNWRSRDGILQFVDLLFGRLWPDYAPMRVADEMDFDKDSSPNVEGVEVWLQRQEEAFGVAKYVEELRADGEPLRDITILVRALKYGLQLQQALGQLGIASRIVGGSERFYTRLEIRDIANALDALTDPHDDFALLATLRSPFCGLSLDSIALLAKARPVIASLPEFAAPVEADQEKIRKFLDWFQPISRYADRLPAWEVMSELFAVSGYLETLARRRNADQLLANVRKLLTLASQEPELGPAEYAGRIREIQNLRHREGDAPAEDDAADMVTIMTIHKAKGLEFEVVVVPEMHKPLEPRKLAIEIDPLPMMVVPRFGKAASPYFTWVADVRKERQVQEEYRVLYVALTRAKRRLCVVAHPQTKKVQCFARVVASTVGVGSSAPAGLRVRDSQDRSDSDD